MGVIRVVIGPLFLNFKKKKFVLDARWVGFLECIAYIEGLCHLWNVEYAKKIKDIKSKVGITTFGEEGKCINRWSMSVVI